MKKSILKSVAFLLAFILAFSALTVGASAAPAAPSNDDILFKAQEVPEVSAAASDFDGATLVTGDFTATVPKNQSYAYYKFVPTQTGWYNVYSTAPASYDTGISLCDSNYKHVGYADSEDENFDLVYPLTAGATYYFIIRDYGYYGKEVTFGVKIGFLGAAEAEVVSYPTKTAYIFEYDTGVYVLYDDVDGEEYWHISLDYDGLEVKLTFDSGKTVTMKDWETGRIFSADYNKPTAVGTYEIRFTAGGATIFTWDVEVVENPVRSMEVVQLPDKTEYVQKLDGWYFYRFLQVYFSPRIEAKGLKVKINYTNGTSETVEFGEDNWLVHDGYWMDVRGGGYSSELGETDVTVSYINKTTTFQVNVVKPTLYQTIILCLIRVTDIFSVVNWLKADFWESIGSWLNGLAHRA